MGLSDRCAGGVRTPPPNPIFFSITEIEPVEHECTEQHLKYRQYSCSMTLVFSVNANMMLVALASWFWLVVLKCTVSEVWSDYEGCGGRRH